MENNNNELELKQTTALATEATAKRELLNMTYKQAQFYANSTIVPAEYQNNPSNCFIAIEMANRMGANPFQVMQSLNIIKGKPSWSSAFIIAAINQSGRFKTQLAYKMEGNLKDNSLACIAWAISNDGTKCESIKVTMEMAKAEGWIDKAGSKWKTMPELMIRYRAASFFGRQYCPDLLLGLMTTEEARDVIDADDFKVTPISAENRFNSTDEVAQQQVEQTASKKPPVKEEVVEASNTNFEAPSEGNIDTSDFDI